MERLAVQAFDAGARTFRPALLYLEGDRCLGWSPAPKERVNTI